MDLKKSIWIGILLLCGFSIPATEAVAQCEFGTDKIVVVSHRGDWRNAPENSIASIQRCIDMGVNMVEIDLKKTKDNHLILLHDQTLDRTTNGKGLPADYTLAQIKQLRLKNGTGRVTFHEIPTLEEALLATKGKIWLNIDKGYDYFDDVLQVLEKTDTKRQIIIKSDHPYGIVSKEHPDILNEVAYMPIVQADRPEALAFTKEYMEAIHPVAFEVCFRTLTPEVTQLIDYIKDSGSLVWINSLWPSLCAGMDDDRAVLLHEKEQTWGQIVRLGANFIQTDRPRELISYLKSRNLFIFPQAADRIRSLLLDRDRRHVSVVSHRGDWKSFPENSLAAIQSVINMGVDIAEIDVQRTKDGQFILMHDSTLDRTTDGEGAIAGKTLAEIRQLRLKDKEGRLTDYPVPTLEEALLLSKGKILLNLDKAERYFDEVMSLVIKLDMMDYVIMKGDFPLTELRSKYGTYIDRLIYMPKFRLNEEGSYQRLAEFVEQMPPVLFEVSYQTDDDKQPLAVKQVTQNSSLLWYNSLAGRNAGHDDVISLKDPSLGYGYLIDTLGARLIQTDEPSYLLEYLRNRGMHD